MTRRPLPLRLQPLGRGVPRCARKASRATGNCRWKAVRWKSSLHGAIPMRRQRWLEVEGFCEVVAGDADGRVGRVAKLV